MNKFIMPLFFLNYFFSQVLNYNFTALSGTYIPLTTFTVIHGANVDESLSSAIMLPFTFTYNCIGYNQIKVSSNGWLTFNTSLTGAGPTNNLNTGPERPVLAPLWDDLQVGSAGSIRYEVQGLPPNQVFVIEWFNMEWNWLAPGPVISFQVKLYQTTNRIEFIYRQESNNVNSGSASIGMNGNNSGDYYSLNNTSASPSALKTTENTNLNTKPASDQVYRWDPVACSGIPNIGTAIANPSLNTCGNLTSTLTVSGFTCFSGLNFQWQSAPAAGGPWTNIPGATSSNHTISILSTTYYRVVVSCGVNSATSGIATGSVSGTNPCGICKTFTNVTIPFTISSSNCGLGNNLSSPPAPCGSSSYYNGEEAIYTFTPSFTGPITITANASSSSWMGVMLHQGCPNSPTSMCVGSAQSSSGPWSFCANVIAGQPYFIVIDSWSPPNCNNFTLSVNNAPITNPCGICNKTFTNVTIPFTIAATNCGQGNVLNNPPVPCGSNSYYNGEESIYSFTPSSSGLISITATAATSSYLGIMLHQGCPNSSTSSCIGNSQSASGPWSFCANVIAGQPYYIVVDSWPSPNCNNYTLSVNNASAPNPCGICNKTFTNVTIPFTIASSNCGSGNSLNNPPVPCGSSSYYNGQEAILSFTPSTSGIINFTANAAASSYLGIMIHQGCPNSSTSTCIGSSQSSSGPWNFCVSVNAGQPYFIVIDSSPSPSCNNFTISGIWNVNTPSCSLSSYTVSNVPYVFENFTGTSYPTTDDVLFSAITFFGFQFCYNGQSFIGSYIASNSSLVFDCFPCFPNISNSPKVCASAGAWTGWSISNPAPTNSDYTPMNAILAPWHDIYPPQGGNIHAITLGTAPNRTFVVCWHDIPMYSASCHSLLHRSQIKLFENGQIIEIHVGNKPLCSTWNNGRAILGLHSYDGTIYIPPVNMTAHNSPTQWTMSNAAYRFTPTCPTISNCATPLPVEFSALYGQQINQVNYVWWEVPNPDIIEEFYVERSFDEGIFSRIATVRPHNQSDKYEYKDYEFKRGGFSYYRIIAKLKSGGYTSTSIYPIYSTEDKMLIKSIYPNPAYDKINLDINSYQPHEASFSLIDNNGTVIKTITKNIPFGFKTQTLDISDLPSGFYLLKIVTPDAVLFEKIIKN